MPTAPPRSSGSASPGSGGTGGCAWPTSSPPAARTAPTWWRSSWSSWPPTRPTWTASSASTTRARGTPSATRPARTWPTGPRSSGCSSRPASASSCRRRCSFIRSSPPTRSSSTTPKPGTSRYDAPDRARHAAGKGVDVTTTPSGGRRCDNDAHGRARLAVLFDMDGLLIDSEPLWLQAETAVMARLGSAWTPADQMALLGGSLDRTVRYLLAKAARPAPPEAVGEWLMREIAERVRREGVPLRPGAAELLAGVDRAGLPRALVTSSERGFMEAVLDSTGLRFDALVCADDVAVTKPDPEPYLLAAKLLGVPPPDCVALEDSPNGVASAQAAGCRVIAVPSLVPIPPAPGRLVVGSLLDLRADAGGITLRDSGG